MSKADAQQPHMPPETKQALTQLYEAARRIWELHPKLVLGLLVCLVLFKDSLIRGLQVLQMLCRFPAFPNR